MDISNNQHQLELNKESSQDSSTAL